MRLRRENFNFEIMFLFYFVAVVSSWISVRLRRTFCGPKINFRRHRELWIVYARSHQPRAIEADFLAVVLGRRQEATDAV